MIDNYEHYNFGTAAISLGHIPTTLLCILIRFVMPREDKVHHQVELMTRVGAIENPGPSFADHCTAFLHIACGIGDDN